MPETHPPNSNLTERARQFVVDAVNGDFARAKEALAAEPGLAHADCWTALVTGDLAKIRELVEREAGFVGRTDGPCAGWTPLLYVCFSKLQQASEEAPARFAACAKVLLEADADPNVAWREPMWPDAPLKSLFGATGVNNNAELARLLLAHGAELNDGESIYHAAQYDHRESMEVLLEAGVSLGWHPLWKNTPLYFLVGMLPSNGDWTAAGRGIRRLLDHGADPNVPCGEKGDTALLMAIRQNHDLEMIGWLLEAGANPNQAVGKGLTPIKLARRAGRREIVELLKKHGGVDEKVSRKDMFFEAAFSGDVSGAEWMVQRYPDILADFTESDFLALNRAAEHGQVEAVRILLESGFDITFKGTKDWGSTPLHTAAWHGHAAVVDLLLARGAQIDIPANPPAPGFPINWAAHGSANCRNPQGDYPRIIRALLAAGAVPTEEDAGMASPEVAEILRTALGGGGWK